MHYTQHWPLYLFILLPLVLSAKPSYKPKQCLRYRDNDIFAETCPAYSQGTVDFSAALFPDAAVISDLSKPNIIENPVYNEPPHKEPGDGLNEPVQATNSSPSKQTSDDDTRQMQQEQQQASKDSRPDASINSTNEQDDSASSNEKRKPLVSFEEWQKKIAQIESDKERRHKRKTLEDEGDGSPNKKQQMVDSIDGGFADDFGSMFEDLLGGVGGKDKKPNVYAEGEYIAPSQSGADSKNKKKQQFADVRMKSLKERFNYASTDCAATVRKVNKQAKGAQSILYESKDQYLLNKCSADKFVIINLCEEIVVDTIVMANFEFFSSTFKDFRVYASSKYPTKEWRLLGQWQARNTRDLQVFKVPYSGFLEYMKIEFLTHYGHEYYCPLSLVRVHGMPMLEFYNTVESKDQYPVLEEEHLWPAEVREQIIQPQFDVNDTAESFPVKIDVDEDDVKPMIPPINIATETPASLEPENTLPTPSDATLEVKAVKTIVRESVKDAMIDHAVEEETGIAEITITQVTSQTENSVPIAPSDTSIDSRDTSKSDTVPVSSYPPSSSSPPPSSRKKASSKSGSKRTKNTADTSPSSSSATKKTPSSTDTNSDTATSKTVKSNRGNVSSEATDSITDTEGSKTDIEAPVVDNTEVTNNTAQLHVDLTVSTTSSTTIVLPQSPSPVPQQPKPIPPNVHQKEGSTQESIYKTIMKRLNVLEVNMTLSQRFLDEQNKILNDVFMDMEKRHQDQLILLIGHLNETASYKIDSMKRRYEQWYEDLKDQTESDMREMTAKIRTFNTLSPVMAAQQEERKRRESIDQSSSLSKETLDILQKSSNSATDATVPTALTEESKPSIIRKLSELPKKPNNPRRHSDSPYHTMAATSKEDGISRKSSYESLGIELHNELLHKKLDDLSQQQQQQQQQRPALHNITSRKSSLENLKEESASIIKNRKRSSTSPPSSAIVP
ncbi:conserved hypothetical protein [Mucor ambiguus]|uniref:SUN domain-containing protein n=1 Tax=Mucor ambiguus TaxID=91626 RepID=A0A0C9N4S6_9FUNG|nr:conserved hypothetical protein [Mucor ambiguus]